MPRALPPTLWEEVDLAPPVPGLDCGQDASRVNYFDSRPWFALHQPVDQVLER